jgi:hypothetical protein
MTGMSIVREVGGGFKDKTSLAVESCVKIQWPGGARPAPTGELVAII